MSHENSNNTSPNKFPVMSKAIEELLEAETIETEDIEKFQDNYWSQLVPKFGEVLKILDIHEVSRHQLLWSINDKLLESVRTQIDAKPVNQGPDEEKSTQKLWQKLAKTGMNYVELDYMRPLMMQVLSKMRSIREVHMSQIMSNPTLYSEAPLPVLRHIWVAHPEKFQQELDQQVEQHELAWFDMALLDALLGSVIADSSSSLVSTSTPSPLDHQPSPQPTATPWINSGTETDSIQSINSGSAATQLVNRGGRCQEAWLNWQPRQQRRRRRTVTDPSLPSTSLHRIADMIGDSQTLYQRVVDSFREKCLRHELSHSIQVGPDSHESSSASVKPPATSSSSSKSRPQRKRKRKRKYSSSSASSSSSPDTSPERRDNSSHIESHSTSSHTQSIQPMLTWCNLRFDILMCLNEAKIDSLCVRDRIHRLVWCLDACVRDRRIDRRHANELAYHLERQRRRAASSGTRQPPPTHNNQGQGDSFESNSSSNKSSSGSGGIVANDQPSITIDNTLECDLHMICREPSVVYTIVTSIIDYTVKGMYKEKLPRHITEVQFLVHLLLIGYFDYTDSPYSSVSGSRTNQDDQEADSPTSNRNQAANRWRLKFNQCERLVVTRLLPALADLQLRSWQVQAHQELGKSVDRLWPGTTPSSPPPSQRKSSIDQPASPPPPVTALNSPSSAPAAWRKRLSAAQAARSRPAVMLGKSSDQVSVPSSQQHQQQPLFRWRPDVLQALVIGLARLPATQPSPSSSPSRGELASLLRTSLPLVNDLQLLSLAQLALLVSQPQLQQTEDLLLPTSPPPTPAHSFSSTTTGSSTTHGDRDKLIHSLARHCATTNATVTPHPDLGGGLGSPPPTGTSSSSYKSSNPRVLAALDHLRSLQFNSTQRRMSGSILNNYDVISSTSTSPSTSEYTPEGALLPFTYVQSLNTPMFPLSPASTPSSKLASTASSRGQSHTSETVSKPIFAVPAPPPPLHHHHHHHDNDKTPRRILSMPTPLTNPGLMPATPRPAPPPTPRLSTPMTPPHEQ